MWRMNYSIAMNLVRLPNLVATMHRMTDQPDKYSEQEIYDYVRYIVGLMKKPATCEQNASVRKICPLRADM